MQSPRLDMARLMHSMVLSTVFLLYLFLLKRLARLWWLLPLATNTQTHCSPIVAFPPVACESLNTRDSHVPRQRPQRLLSWRRHLIRPSPQHARLLLPMQPRQCLKPRRNSLHPVAPRCYRIRCPRLYLSRFPRLIYLESPAEKLPRAEPPRAEPRVVELNRLADLQAIPTMTPTRRNAIGRLTSSEKASS